jgi:hypothetical protein
MSLVSCGECGHKVSDRAAACPSCGAPLGESNNSVELSKNTFPCPFCSKPIHESAITCGYCGAEKGYYDGSNVYSSKWTVIIFGIIVPIILAFAAIALFVIVEGGALGAIGVLFWLLIILFAILKSLWQLIRGPRWWKSR